MQCINGRGKQVFASLHGFLSLYATAKGLPAAAASDLFDRLQREVMQPGAGLEEALGDVARLAQRLWTTDQRLQGVAGGAEGWELCWVLNDVIRSDDALTLQAAMPLVRAINTLCVVRGALPDELLSFPPDHACYRGAGLPVQKQEFFSVGQKYRVPGFLATSFKREVCSVVHNRGAFPGIRETFLLSSSTVGHRA